MQWEDRKGTVIWPTPETFQNVVQKHDSQTLFVYYVTIFAQTLNHCYSYQIIVLKLRVPQMSLKGCFALRFTVKSMDKLVQKISTSITVLYGPFSAHEAQTDDKKFALAQEQLQETGACEELLVNRPKG